MSWFLPGSLRRKQFPSRLGSINQEELGDFISSPSHIVEADLLGQTRLSLAYFFMLRVFTSYVGSSCSLWRGQIRVSLLSHSPFRDAGHLNSKQECSCLLLTETRCCASQRSTYEQGKWKTEPVAWMSHASRVVTGTYVTSSGSADQVLQTSTSDLQAVAKHISLSIRETGMKPLPSPQWFAPEYVCMTIQKLWRSGWRKDWFLFLFSPIRSPISTRSPIEHDYWKLMLLYKCIPLFQDQPPSEESKRRLERSCAISRHFCGSNVMNSQDRCLV